MSTGLQQLSYVIANLAAGRNPVLEIAPLDCTVFPPRGSGGYPTSGAMVASVIMVTREHPGFRTAYLKITNYDATGTYTATIAGTGVTRNAATVPDVTLADMLAGWAAAINANVTTNVIVLAEPYASDGVVLDSIRLSGLTSADYSIAGSKTGTATIAVTADPISMVVTMYGRSVAVPSSVVGSDRARVVGWKQIGTIDGQSQIALDGNGVTAQIECNTLAAAFGYATSVVGVVGDGGSVVLTPRVFVLPCREESST